MHIRFVIAFSAPFFLISPSVAQSDISQMLARVNEEKAKCRQTEQETLRSCIAASDSSAASPPAQETGRRKITVSNRISNSSTGSDCQQRARDRASQCIARWEETEQQMRAATQNHRQ